MDDSYCSHEDSEKKEEFAFEEVFVNLGLEGYQINRVKVIKMFTFLSQPLDLCFNAVFKKAYYELLNQFYYGNLKWKITCNDDIDTMISNMILTKARNMKICPREKLILFYISSFNSVSEASITESFKKAGIGKGKDDPDATYIPMYDFANDISPINLVANDFTPIEL